MPLAEAEQMARADDIIRNGGDPLDLVDSLIDSSGISRNLLIARLRDHRPMFQRLLQDDGVEYLSSEAVVRRILKYMIFLGE